MSDVSYERPREKMQQRGVQALNTAELLQVILGSGTKGHSVAKVAREVARLLERSSGQPLQFAELMKVKGLGTVKSLQLIAMQGLSSRLACAPDSKDASGLTSLHGVLVEVAQKKRKTVRYCLLDGSDAILFTEDRNITSVDHYAKIVRYIFSQALARGAYAVAFSIGSTQQALVPSAYELGVANAAQETSKALQIYIASGLLVSPAGEAVLLRRTPDG